MTPRNDGKRLFRDAIREWLVQYGVHALLGLTAVGLGFGSRELFRATPPPVSAIYSDIHQIKATLVDLDRTQQAMLKVFPAREQSIIAADVKAQQDAAARADRIQGFGQPDEETQP